MTFVLAVLEWSAATAALWFAAEASGTGSTLAILTAAVCAIVAAMARALAFRGAITREMDALHDRLGLASRGGAR